MKPAVVAVRGAHEAAFLAAAYLLTDRAYVVVGRSRGARTVSLWPKRGARGAGLAALFRGVYEGQLRRQAGLPALRRAERDALALAVAAPAPQRETPRELSAERRREIERLRDEADGPSAGDPLGIRSPWDQR